MSLRGKAWPGVCAGHFCCGAAGQVPHGHQGLQGRAGELVFKWLNCHHIGLSWVSHKHSAKHFHSITHINYLSSPLQGCGLLFYAKCAVIKFDISTWIKYVVWWANGRWLFLLAIWRMQPHDVRQRERILYSLFYLVVFLLLKLLRLISQYQEHQRWFNHFGRREHQALPWLSPCTPHEMQGYGHVCIQRCVRDILDNNRLLVIVSDVFPGTDHMIGFNCPTSG